MVNFIFIIRFLAEQDTDKFLLLSTAILIRILEIRYAAAKEIWESVVQKSRKWLAEVIDYSKSKLRDKDLAVWVEEFLGQKS